MKCDIAPVRWGILIAMVTLLMGVYLGIQFGKNEDKIIAGWKARAEVSAVFGGDAKKIDAAVEAGWKYLKRSHEHFQGLGAIAVGVCLVLAALPLKCWPKIMLSVGISLGGFVYPLFWYLAADRCAEMGKSSAKESLALMAQAGAGLYLISLLCVALAVGVFAMWKNNPPAMLHGIFKASE